jgi:caffeoyl-CoA O-methyltransferase
VAARRLLAVVFGPVNPQLDTATRHRNARNSRIRSSRSVAPQLAPGSPLGVDLLGGIGELVTVSRERPLVDPDIVTYADTLTSAGHSLYARLVEETQASTLVPGMQLGRIEGRLLTLLAQLAGARRAIELGTFTGYSALAIAEGLAPDGTLLTCDVDARCTEIALRYFAQAPWGRKIELRLGPALETLAAVEGPFDFAFLDADKERYVEYWEALVPKVAAGGLLVVDNVFWSGTVLQPRTRGARAVAAFNEHVRHDTRVDTVTLTVRDGLLLARKRTAD